VNVMRKKTARSLSAEILGKAAGVILVLSGLATLVGCQGLSQSGSGQPSSMLALGNASIDFGDVTPGKSKTVTISANNSGTKTVTISGASFSSKYFSLASPTLPVSVAPGLSTPLTISFTPNAASIFNGTLTVTSDASDPIVTASLTGAGTGLLQLNPTAESFGSVTVGSTKSQTITLTNGDSSSVSVSQISVSGAGFSLTGATTPLTLAASQSTNFTVTFAPNASGNASGTVTITSDAPNPTLTMSLSGTGVAAGALSANPTSLSFGNVNTGSTGTLSETITNIGGTSVTVSQVGVTGTGLSVSGITTPLTLNAGQSTNLTVSFAPGTGGAVSGTLTITSTASNPTLTIPVSGTGVAPGALTANPTSLSFGNVSTGSKGTLSETITNTGTTSVSISQISVNGSGFSVSRVNAPLTLTASQSTSFTVSFAPTSSGSATGTLTITSDAPNPTLTVSLSGTGVTPGTLSANPTSLAFGNVTVGSTGTLSETITNTGGTSVSVSQVGITGTGFSVSGITTPLTLNTGQSASLTISFDPNAAGTFSGNLTITSTATNPTLTIPVSGAGVVTSVGILTVSPATLSLGNVATGTSGSASGTLKASGASVTVSAASTNNSAFTITGFVLPQTIAAGQSVPFTITFSPTVPGSATATLTFTSNAQPNTTTEALTGTGTHVVDLVWNASTSSNIAGYNIYRFALTSNGACPAFQQFTKINTALQTITQYTDTNGITSGNFYCYATTAVDTSNQESGPSNTVLTTQIP